jgi:hypothetical protein
VSCSAVILLAVPKPAAAYPSPEKQALIHEVFQLTHALDSLDQVVSMIMPQALAALRQRVPNMSPADLDRLNAVLVGEFKANADSYEQLLIQLYDRNYTVEELQAMLVFYKSPAGRSIVAKLPTMRSESLALGARWGAEIGRRAAEHALQKGRELGYAL